MIFSQKVNLVVWRIDHSLKNMSIPNIVFNNVQFSILLAFLVIVCEFSCEILLLVLMEDNTSLQQT